MQIEFIKFAVITFSVAAILIILCQRFKLPSILGFLFTGIILSASGAVNSHSTFAEVASELGIILLMFTLGIEFSLQKLNHIKKIIIFGGGTQIICTIGVFSFLSIFVGLGFQESVFLGILLALSSTAIVMKILQETLQLDSPQGKNALGLLIAQDFAVILFMLLIPVLAGSQTNIQGIVFPVAKSLGLIAIILFASIKLVPWLLRHIIALRSNELFLISLVVICLSIAYLTSSLGLSLGIGAFLAGLAISESEYNHQALILSVPFRDIFLGFFFVSVGLILDLNYLLGHSLLILSLLPFILLFKGCIIWGSLSLLKLPIRSCFLASIFLCQIGEFSFILAKEGFNHNLISENNYQLFLVLSVLSMLITPILIRMAPRISNRLQKLWLFQNWDLKENEEYSLNQSMMQDHIVIVGYGITGKWIATLCKIIQKPYIILEANPNTVSKELSKGENIIFGDATNLPTLNSLQIKEADSIVLCISDPKVLPLIVANIKQLNPNIHIIVRTNFLHEHSSLHRLEINELVCKEFESTVAIVQTLMNRFDIPEASQTHIHKLIADYKSSLSIPKV